MNKYSLKVAVFLYSDTVAGAKPAVGERLFRGLLVAPVAHGDILALKPQLARLIVPRERAVVADDACFHPWEQQANTAGLIPAIC